MATSGTTSASSSTLACFFRQRVSIVLQRAQAVAVRRRTMALDGLPSLPPRDPLHGLDIAHIAGFPGAGGGLLVVYLVACFVLLSLSCVLRHFVPVHSFVFVVGPLLFSMAFVIPF